MNGITRPVEETELQAYVDEQLNASRRAEVEAWLATHPQDAERVQAYRRQNEMLHARFDTILEEPVAGRLRVPVMPRRARVFLRYSAMAASLVVAVAAGWLARGFVAPEPPPLAATLAHPAAVAHVAYVPDVQHPVEVDAAQEQHLVKWLSKRLGAPVRAPNLNTAGFALVGGRLLPGEGRPAAQFMYQDLKGDRLTLYVRADLDGKSETAFRYAREGDVSVFYWVDGPYGYALSGDVDREQLLAVAEAVYHALNR